MVYSLFPLGDSAMTLDLGNSIDEHHNIRVQIVREWLQKHVFPGLLDIIVAYSSISVFYDAAVVRANVAAGHSANRFVRELLERAWTATATDPIETQTAGKPGVAGLNGAERGHFHRIPVCYSGEYAPDIESVAKTQGMSMQEIITLHTGRIYRVYMLGFLPGFPYMGIVDPRLQVPRKIRPVPVVAGAVGITGGQTGIYPLNSPGGWTIIGRSPLKLFDPFADPPVTLQTGDSVQFYPISPSAYRELSGRPE